MTLFPLTWVYAFRLVVERSSFEASLLIAQSQVLSHFGNLSSKGFPAIKGLTLIRGGMSLPWVRQNFDYFLYSVVIVTHWLICIISVRMLFGFNNVSLFYEVIK